MRARIAKHYGLVPTSLAVAIAVLTGSVQYAVAHATVLHRGPDPADAGYYVKTLGEIAAMIAICIVSFSIGCRLLRVRAWFSTALVMFVVEAVLGGEAWHLLPQLGSGRLAVVAAILILEYLAVMPFRRSVRSAVGPTVRPDFR